MVFYFGVYTFYTDQKHYSSHTTVTAAMVDCSGNIVSYGKNIWYNRPWERWRHQSAILNAIGNAIESKRAEIKAELKEANQWERITKAREASLNRAYDESKELQALVNLRNEVYNAPYGNTEQKEELESLERTCKVMELLFGMLREGEKKNEAEV